MAGSRRWISSRKKTSRGSSEVRMAVKSPLRSSSGPELVLMATPSSIERICASVVLPRPGGPKSRTWSSASPRLRAASTAMEMFSFTRDWPMKSAMRWGRTLASMRASSSNAWPETMRCGDRCICCFVIFVVAPVSPACPGTLLGRTAQLLYRGAQQHLKARAAAVALRLLDRLLGGAAIIAQVEQGRDNVRLKASARGGPGLFRRFHRRQPIAQFDHDALGGLLAHAGDARQQH